MKRDWQREVGFQELIGSEAARWSAYEFRNSLERSCITGYRPLMHNLNILASLCVKQSGGRDRAHEAMNHGVLIDREIRNDEIALR